MNTFTYVYLTDPVLTAELLQMGVQTIEDAGGQPFRLTNVTLSYNEKYTLLNVTPSEDQQLRLSELVDAGTLTLVQEAELVTDQYGTDLHTTQHTSYPPDFAPENPILGA